MRTLFSVAGSLYVPSNSAAGAAALVATWDKACGAKHHTSARKRGNVSVRARMMVLGSAEDLFFNGHHSNQTAADMITECWRLRGANRGVRRDGNP